MKYIEMHFICKLDLSLPSSGRQSGVLERREDAEDCPVRGLERTGELRGPSKKDVSKMPDPL